MRTPTQKTWNAWAERVLKELATLNNRYEHLQNELDEKYAQLQATLEKTNLLLTGNGSPEKGLLVRVDRLEVAQDKRTWMIRAALVSALMGIVAAVRSAFNGHSH